MGSEQPSSSAKHQVVIDQWVPFKSEMLQNLNSEELYKIRAKSSITSPVPGITKCSPEDQQMFLQVDEMERSLLEGVIKAKVKELNTAVPKGNQKEWRAARTKELGDLLEMGYDQILIKSKVGPSC